MPIAAPDKPKDSTMPYYSLTQGVNRWRIYKGDCIDSLEWISLASGRQQYEFMFGDPPFNIGQQYKGFVDRVPVGKHSVFTHRWISAAIEHLAPNGIMALHGPDALVELYFRVMAKHPEFVRIAWVNWHYRFGQCNYHNWIDSRCHCLLYCRKDQHYIWNPQDVLVDSDRATTYHDKRIESSIYKGKRVPFTIFGIPSDGPNWGRIQGGNRERAKAHPNQLPEVYLKRLLLAYTNRNGKTADLFSGSGTMPTVAHSLGRSCDAFELGKEYCESIKSRLKKGAVRI